jgi:hypothetical protein
MLNTARPFAGENGILRNGCFRDSRGRGLESNPVFLMGGYVLSVNRSAATANFAATAKLANVPRSQWAIRWGTAAPDPGAFRALFSERFDTTKHSDSKAGPIPLKITGSLPKCQPASSKIPLIKLFQ